MTEAELARLKLDRLCEELRYLVPLGNASWDLIDGIYQDIDRLEKKAYIVIRIPRMPWSKRT